MSAFAAKICTQAKRCCTPAQSWMPARWRCWQRRKRKSARQSAIACLHFTTGDEIIPPDQTPKPGQIRDSNSFLIRGLLQRFPCDVTQKHLPEDFEAVQSGIDCRPSAFCLQPSNMLLVSGGASVGEKDFTRPLLEWLGFEIVFSQVNVRPGRPLIFGVNGEASVPASRVAFGLPGNPLSHFVCFHLCCRDRAGETRRRRTTKFLRGPACREIGRRADIRAKRSGRLNWRSDRTRRRLHPLAWASSGNVTCLAEANALIRVPANAARWKPFAEVDFLPTDF